MKIPLHMGQGEAQASKEAQARMIERDLTASKKGDWNAKNNLTRTFMPLITSLAEKRTQDKATLNKYIEAGKQGLLQAIRKYRTGVGADKFQLFALDFIESSMNHADKPAGFFARLFGRR